MRMNKLESSYRLLSHFPTCGSDFRDLLCLVGGYSCRKSDDVTDEVIKASIVPQAHERDDVLRIEGATSP
jgi:hypothetical protein